MGDLHSSVCKGHPGSFQKYNSVFVPNNLFSVLFLFIELYNGLKFTTGQETDMKLAISELRYFDDLISTNFNIVNLFYLNN